MRSLGTLVCAVLGASPSSGQDEVFSRDYAFEERQPATTLEQLIATKMPSLVKVHGASGLSTIQAYATGVLVSAEGHVLTLDLIMLQKDQTRVVLHDGSVHRAELLAADRQLGVRMLKIDAEGLALRPLAPTERTDWRHGVFVASLGNSFRLAEFSEKISATFGVLVARARTGLRYRLADLDYDGELLITDAPNNPGHFGGALFSLDGEWIGLNTKIVESVETNTQISAALPSWELAAYIDRSVSGELMVPSQADEPAAAPPRHGIVLFDRGLRRSPPAYVERVLPDSPARRIGLRPDDLIVRVGESSIRTCAEFRRVMASHAAGDVVEITFKRGVRVLRESMTLEAPK